MFTFVNDQFFAEDKATIHVSDLTIQRGYGVFDFFRTRNNTPLFLDDYLNRFFNSAAFMRLQPAQSREQLTAIIDALIKKNDLPDSGIKMILTGGYSLDSYEPPAKPNLIITQQKLQMPSPETFTAGIKVITHQYQRDLPGIKSINYLMGVWLQQKVMERNAVDVLYYKEGMISEFPRANVFMVTTDQKIVTPTDNVLHGITRMKLLELAATKYAVEMRPIHISEIKNAAEVFMTSTTKRLLPISQIDDVVISEGKAGPVTSLLNTAFVNMEENILQSAIQNSVAELVF